MENSEVISYKTSSPAGDLISFLAGMKQVYEDTGKKAKVFQRLGMPGISYAGSVHPFEDEEGMPICLSRYMFDMLSPLLKSQEYIEDFVEYTGQEFQFDLDYTRLKEYTGQPGGCLNRWFSYVFPDMSPDLSKKWILLPEQDNHYKEKIILNFTARHRNHILTYFFLKPHQEHLVFAGLKKERDVFCNTWGLDIPLLEVKDFLELANIINGCRFFLGNASMCYQIAEATKCKRILEMFPDHPNVIPVGRFAYDAYHQVPIEYFFYKLMK